MKTDDELLSLAVKIAVPRHRRGKVPRWSAVMDVFAVGSTVAWELCERFGHDPDEMVRK